MYKKPETFPILLAFFQASSTLGHLFLPRQRIERIWGAKAEKRQWQEQRRSHREFFTSLRPSSRVFTGAHCSADSPVTYREPAPGNKAPDRQHSKCRSHPRRERPTRTACHYRCAQSAGAIRPLAVRESGAACCEAGGGQPNDTCSQHGEWQNTSHTHTLIQIPLVSLQPAGREPMGR